MTKVKLANPILNTSAWLLKDLTDSKLGRLTFDGQRIAFKSSDKKLDFDVPLKELKNLNYPWYYFGGGFKASVMSRPIRISLTTPNGQIDPDDLDSEAEHLGLVKSGLIVAFDAIKNIGKGRKKMALWRKIFNDHQAG